MTNPIYTAAKIMTAQSLANFESRGTQTIVCNIDAAKHNSEHEYNSYLKT